MELQKEFQEVITRLGGSCVDVQALVEMREFIETLPAFVESKEPDIETIVSQTYFLSAPFDMNYPFPQSLKKYFCW